MATFNIGKFNKDSLNQIGLTEEGIYKVLDDLGTSIVRNQQKGYELRGITIDEETIKINIEKKEVGR
jgi:hypothetical protein